MDKVDIDKFMKAASFGEPWPWTKCYNYVEDTLEKVHKLEMVSGYSIDSLISLFAAGWKLSVSTYEEPTLPVNWWSTEQAKEANRLRDEFLAKPIDIDVEELEEMIDKLNNTDTGYVLPADKIKKILDHEEGEND